MFLPELSAAARERFPSTDDTMAATAVSFVQSGRAIAMVDRCGVVTTDQEDVGDA
jgi:hypothetical protein